MTEPKGQKKSPAKKSPAKKAAAKKETQKSAKELQAEKELIERAATRFRTIYAGKVHQEGRAQNCTVLDLSASGAKLKGIKNLASIPDDVDLVIERLGPYRGLRCEVIWRTDEFLGVRFANDPEYVRELISELMPGRLKTAES